MDLQQISKIFGPNYEGMVHDGAETLAKLNLPANVTVLDVGTGAGKFATLLAAHGFTVLTGEPESDDSPYAKKNWSQDAEALGVDKHLRFQHFDAEAMPFESNAFASVFFFGVLHHIDEAVRPDVLREALRVVQPEGAVVFFEPRRETLEKLWVSDPDHPDAADPSAYLGNLQVHEERIEGGMMNITIYRKDSTSP